MTSFDFATIPTGRPTGRKVTGGCPGRRAARTQPPHPARAALAGCRARAAPRAVRSPDRTGPGEGELAVELSELEEEEQSLERLRRWHRDLTARDVFGSPERAAADARFKGCVAARQDYAERVFAAVHAVGRGQP